MTRTMEKREGMQKSDYVICPKIMKRLDYLVADSRRWTTSWDGQKKFGVKQGTRLVTVDLDAKSYSCRLYDLTGIPCEHAIAAIYERRHHLVDYVSEYYKWEKYLAAFEHSLEAIMVKSFRKFTLLTSYYHQIFPKN